MATSNGNGKSLSLPEDAKGNYHLSIDEGTKKTIFNFPEKAEMTRGRCKFRNQEDLQKYIGASLSSGNNEGQLRGSVCRRGKYQKVDKSGNPVLTIGDPILDLISDEEGRIFIGGEVFSLTEAEFSSARYRNGGIRSIDLSGVTEELAQSQLLSAAKGEGDFVLVESSERGLAFASTNPSQRDYYPPGGGHLRFKAWKKNYFFYWSMGAEIETWGGDFSTASIQSTYIDSFYAQICFVVKRDADSDRNDDYVDEYEWGVGPWQPKRVVSLCDAQFKGQHYVGIVEAGPACFTIGDPGIFTTFKTKLQPELAQ